MTLPPSTAVSSRLQLCIDAGSRKSGWLLTVVGWMLLAVGTCPGGRAAAQEQPAQPPADPPAENPADAKLPKLQDLQVPSAEELLTTPARDWIVLKTVDVIICDSVVPRPDTLARHQATLKALMDSRA